MPGPHASLAKDATAQPYLPTNRKRTAEIFMMDLLATVPYYTAYLSRALLNAGLNVRIGSITYYLDRGCFTTRHLRLQPGCLNVVGGMDLSPAPRRLLKLAEFVVNLAALTLRFAFKPAAIIHVQYLPLLRWPVPLDLWFVRLCSRRGSKVVLTVHDLLPHDTADRYRAVFERLYKRVDRLICHSDHIRERLEREFSISSDTIAVIPHGPFFFDLPPSTASSTRSRLGIPAKHQIVLWQGIIFPYKGLDLLLEAWKQVEQESCTAHLIIVGTGAPELLTEVREQVRRLGLQRVALDLRFASTEELVEAYRDADAVVYPYRAITTSGALATGLALGKAIVATDLPVFRELLTDGENARLVPPGDTGALAAAIVQVLSDHELRQQFIDSVAGMNFALQSWQAIAEKTAAVYDRVLADSSAAPR